MLLPHAVHFDSYSSYFLAGSCCTLPRNMALRWSAQTKNKRCVPVTQKGHAGFLHQLETSLPVKCFSAYPPFSLALRPALNTGLALGLPVIWRC